MFTRRFPGLPRRVSLLRGAALLVCAALSATTVLAAGDETVEISRLVQSGQLADAMKRVDDGLAQKPAEAGDPGIVLEQAERVELGPDIIQKSRRSPRRSTSDNPDRRSRPTAP